MAFKTEKVEPPLLDGVTATGASRWINVSMYDDLVIHLAGLGSGDTVEVQGTNWSDKSNPATLATVNDAGDVIKVEAGMHFIRLNLTGLSSGGPINSKTLLRKRL